MNIIAYADDIVLLADSQDNLSAIYELFRANILRNRLKINKNKSKCIIFKRFGRADGREKVTLGGDEFEVVLNYKYLGHHIQSDLMDLRDVGARLNAF